MVCRRRPSARPILDEIVAELRDERYDLLVVGAHRVASALNRLLLKVMTSDLIESSPWPVVVVKGTRSRWLKLVAVLYLHGFVYCLVLQVSRLDPVI
jgi:hypothetical protein